VFSILTGFAWKRYRSVIRDFRALSPGQGKQERQLTERECKWRYTTQATAFISFIPLGVALYFGTLSRGAIIARVIGLDIIIVTVFLTAWLLKVKWQEVFSGDITPSSLLRQCALGILVSLAIASLWSLCSDASLRRALIKQVEKVIG